MAETKRLFNFTLKEIKIKDIILLPQAIGELNIYESISNPGITGNITIADWQGFNEVGEIFAMDDIEISFTTETRDDLKLKYKIYSSTTNMTIGNTYHPIQYNFCSPWLIDAYTRQLSVSYKNKYIHEIVSDLLVKCGASLGFIEPTKQKLNRFTTPLWTPLKSLHYLSSFAMNKENKAGYIFWTDLKTGLTNYTTIDYLYQGKYGKEDAKFLSLPQNQLYESRIFNLSLEDNFDIIKYVNQGIGKTIQQGYYFDKDKTVTYNKSINEIEYTHLSEKLPINNVFNSKKYATIKGNYLYPSNDTLVIDDNEFNNMLEGMNKNRYVKLFSDVFKINIVTNPNSSRRVGNLTELEYQSTDKNIVGKNKLYSGMYLIRNIRHFIFNGYYQPIVTLISDGLKESKNDLITWSKK